MPKRTISNIRKTSYTFSQKPFSIKAKFTADSRHLYTNHPKLKINVRLAHEVSKDNKRSRAIGKLDAESIFDVTPQKEGG